MTGHALLVTFIATCTVTCFTERVLWRTAAKYTGTRGRKLVVANHNSLHLMVSKYIVYKMT